MANDKVSLWGDALKFGRSPATGDLLVGNGSGFDLTASNVTWGDPVEFTVPIKVDGQVWSTTTGFKFPDGTIQATAASSYAPSSVPNNTIISNVSGVTAAAGANTLTQVLDATAASAQGSVLYRNSSSWVALAPGTAGQVLTTGGASADPSWAQGSAWTTIKKTSDQSITSSTTFVNDSELQFSVVSGATYFIRGFYSINLGNGGGKVACNGPTFTKLRGAIIYSSATAITAYDTSFNSLGGPAAFLYGFNICVQPSASGTFAIRIAQQTSSSVTTVFEKGSWIEYLKVS
jgi:hypothetical protein